MGNNNKTISGRDIKSQLALFKRELISSQTPEERACYEAEIQDKKRREEIKRENLVCLCRLLAAYKQNSGIYINNFFRGRDFKTYLEDKWDIFDEDACPFPDLATYNVFGDEAYSWQMVGALRKCEESGLAYYPINKSFVTYLTSFYEYLNASEPLEKDTVFYRGCTNLERNGVNGIVSVTSNYRVAEQFSRGTILTITVPAGTRLIDISEVRRRVGCKSKKDFENEYLLPPCDYEITSIREGKKGREPNNFTGSTKFIELTVKPLDLLDEFLEAMESPPQEYDKIMNLYSKDYTYAIEYLRFYIADRKSVV